MASSVILGAIGDDFTGAVELAGMLTAGGARTVFVTSPGGIPSQIDDTEAVVVALRSRVAPPKEALKEIDQAASAFQKLRVRQIFFKYCATFDSTDHGNIGNCAEVLMERVGARTVLFCPSFPEAFRTVYQGHHFVGDRLLANSPKRHDPLTPMTRSDLVEVLAPQTSKGVGLLPWTTVQAGASAIRAFAEAKAADGTPFLIADAITEADLRSIAAATWNWPLMTGGSSVAAYYPALWRRQGLMPNAAPPRPGHRSRRRRRAGRQLRGSHARTNRCFRPRPPRPEPGSDGGGRDGGDRRAGMGPVGRIVQAVLHREFGRSGGGRHRAESIRRHRGRRRAERLLGRIAQGLVVLGVRRFVVAGGETSGAVVQALGVEQLHVAAYTRLGVGRCTAEMPTPLSFCLKSGKLGDVDMFARVLDEMGGVS